jgi:hypothetical protein
MRSLVTALAALGLGGCTTLTGEFEGPIHERFKIRDDASAECISAAKRATRWCTGLEKDVWADMTYGVNCNEARWDYARHCR